MAEKMITSRENPLVKYLIRIKKRKEKNLLFLEGERLVEDALKKLSPEKIFISEEKFERNYPIIPVVLSKKIFQELSETKNSQGVIGIFKRPEMHIDELFKCKKVFYLDKIRDPGNLGTIIRSADAFSIDALVLGKGTVDPFMPKVLRATMGSVFRVPIFFDTANNDLVKKWKVSGELFATKPKCDKSFAEAKIKEPYMIVLGNEAFGVSDEILREAKNFYLPMSGNAESLNAAVCASILMYLLQEVNYGVGGCGQI